jgi:hypothetical protein
MAQHIKFILFFTRIILLPNTFNVQNTIDLINKQNNININHNIRICSFDITNMYTNIPLNNFTTIIRNRLSKGDTPQPIINEIDRITKLIIEQNYFIIIIYFLNKTKV